MDVQSRRDGPELYEFGEFALDVPERRLTHGALRVHLAAEKTNGSLWFRQEEGRP